MRAIQVSAFGSTDNLVVQDISVPIPKADEVLVKVEYASLNFADIMARKGQYRTDSMPFVGGLDFTGIVQPSDSAPQELVGKRVMGFATACQADFVVAKQALVAVVPTDLDVTRVAASPLVACTAIELLERAAKVLPGEKVAIYAASGGVGQILVQLSKRMGMGKILALVGSASKAKRAQELGASATVIYRGDNAANYSEEVLGETDGVGVDAIFNSIAGWTFDQDSRMLAPFGRSVVYGMASGEPGIIPSNKLHPTSRSIIGYSFSNLRNQRPYEVKPILKRAVDLLQQGIEFQIAEIFKPGDAPAAHTLLESGGSQGKILFDFN